MTSARTRNLPLLHLAMAGVALALAGCGGGGGDSGTEGSLADTQVPVGVTPAPSAGQSPAPAPTDEAAPGPAPAPAPVTVPSPSPNPSADAGAPGTPTSLSATAPLDSRIELGWSASSGAVASYVVTRCEGVGCTPDTQVAVTNTTEFSDNELTPDTAYVYQVVARDGEGRESAPAQATAVTKSPPGGAVTPSATGPNVSVPGVLRTPYPTLQNATIEWPYSGDANANGWASMRYRARGDTVWSVGMPLRRVLAGSSSGFSWSTRHSGSLFDLKPGTTYDVQVSLLDPDGGSVIRSTVVTTRPVPAPMAGAPVKTASPSTLASVLAGAAAGDIIQLAAGTYGPISVEKDGAAGRPLVIRGASGAVINGEVSIYHRRHVMLQGLTVNGAIRFNGSDNISVTRCTVNANASVRNGDGIVTYLRSENAYIADNVVNGTTAWAGSSLGVNGNNRGEGIQVTGPGHVIMNNRVSGFRDNISLLEDDEAVDQFSIDILNNDLSAAADDAVEADFCFHNCRIMRNRITNAFIGLSSQPSLGGPTYFIRNVMYNVAHVAFKLYRGSYGDVLLHNTVVKGGDGFAVNADTPVGRLFTRNNLFIGGPGGSFGGYSSGSGRVIHLPTLQAANASMNYDAYGSTLGTFTGNYGGSGFSGLAQLRSSTAEKNALQVDLSVFAASITLPTAALTHFARPDLRLRSGGAAENAGVAIANINDRYTGRAPDVGAYEVGAPLPVYGPR